jgi:Domain of unknown function (DUF4189)/Peptidase_C39 like family
MRLSRYLFAAQLSPGQRARAVARGFRFRAAGNLSISRLAGALLAAIALIMAYPAASSAAQARHTVTEAPKLAAAAGNYGAWAFSEGDMPSSVRYGFGATQGQAEVAAVGACEAAGGGSGGSANCYARAWFENAFSSFAYDASGGYWGESWASSSARADSLALGYCASQGGATDCAIVARAQTANPTGVAGELIQATPSYGVWAISPSAHVASWGVGDTIQSAQQAAIPNCEAAGGKASECSVYGAWVENGYSAIYMGANGTWSVSVSRTPAGATKLAQHECQTVKAPGLTCTLKGSGVTVNPWVATKLGWIKQPGPATSQLPYIAQYQRQPDEDCDCGAADALMVIVAYGTHVNSSQYVTFLKEIRADSGNNGVCDTATGDYSADLDFGQLEAALSSAPWSLTYAEVPKSVGSSDVALARIKAAVDAGKPVIALVHGTDLSDDPQGALGKDQQPGRGYDYGDHFVVVKAVSGTTVTFSDPDNQTAVLKELTKAGLLKYPYWLVGGPNTTLSVAQFEKALTDVSSGNHSQPYAISVGDGLVAS